MKGFTFIEIILSVSIFIYVFVNIMSIYINFSTIYLKTINTAHCSSFSMLLIQNLLTNIDGFIIASSSEQVSINQYGFETEILVVINGSLYLYDKNESNNFLSGNMKDYKLDYCGQNKIKFRNSSVTSVDGNSGNSLGNLKFRYINPSVCLDMVYVLNASTTSSSSTEDVVTTCAFK